MSSFFLRTNITVSERAVHSAHGKQKLKLFKCFI